MIMILKDDDDEIDPLELVVSLATVKLTRVALK